MRIRLEQILNSYWINSNKVDWITFSKILFDTDKYKQIAFYNVINKDNQLVKRWVLENK